MTRGQSQQGSGPPSAPTFSQSQQSPFRLIEPFMRRLRVVSGSRRWRIGELNWSSQHLEAGGCDGQSKTAFGTIWAAAIVVTRSTARGRTPMSGDGSGPPLRRAWQVRTLRLRPVCRRLSEQDGSGRQAACHQRCLGRSAKPLSGRYLSLAEREELRSYVCRARECGRSPGRWGGQRRRSRGVRRNAATRSGGLDYRATTAQWHADRAARRPSLRSWRSTRAASVCAGSISRRGRNAAWGCGSRSGGVLERSPTRTSAGSAVGLGVEPGADCPSLTARLPAR